MNTKAYVRHYRHVVHDRPEWVHPPSLARKVIARMYEISRSGGVYETMLATLTGRKFLLRGNHDKHRANYYQWLGFEVLDPHCEFALTEDRQIKKARVLRQTVLGRRLALSHVPIKDDGSWDLNLRGHIRDNYRIADPKWVNLSVEVRRYRPVRLG